MERFAEIVAALKLRTSNKKVATSRPSVRLSCWRRPGVDTPEGLVRAPVGLLKRPTIDRLLHTSGLDYARVIRPTAAVRFQARHANQLWHFDMSPSDLKQVEAPLWIEEGRGKPTLMLFSVVDDRSGVTYQEYRCVYGENAEAALRFLFTAMAPKPEPELPFQGIPTTLYMDNDPVSRAKVFQSVMGSEREQKSALFASTATDDCKRLHLPVVTRKRNVADARFRILSGADCLRRTPASDARFMRRSAN